MKRRDFMLLVGGTAMAPPWGAALAQPTKLPRIGFFSAPANDAIGNQQAFVSGLREAGFNEGQNFVLERRDTTDSRGPFATAADLMRTQPDLVVVTGPEVALQAVIEANRSIPIVFLAVQFDPIARGYVQSLARPGGNITGVFQRQLELAGKQVEILAQTFPQRTRLAILHDALTADPFSEAESAAKALNIQVQALRLGTPPYDFSGAFQRAMVGGAQMVLVLSSPHFAEQRAQIAELAIEHRLPTMFTFRHYTEAGGLISYGVNFPAMFRKVGDYAARILKGTKPADLPVEQAAVFETVVNLKTAKAIGVDLPTSILLRADKVIE